MLLTAAVMFLVGCATETSVSVPIPDTVLIGGAQPLAVGDSTQLTVTVTAKGAVIASPVLWTSTNPSVAAIGSGGILRAFARGTTTISATAGPVSSTAVLSVIGVRSVTVTPVTVTIPIGGTTLLTTLVDPDPGVSAPVTWGSRNPSVATVSAAGAVTGVAVGTVAITATARGTEGASVVTVIPPPPAISNLTSFGSVGVQVGRTVQVVPSVVRANSSVSVGYSYQSSDQRTAIISSSGVVTGVSAGNAVVTITASGVGVGVIPTILTFTIPVRVSP
jgi:uncharacterized protein YjdB